MVISLQDLLKMDALFRITCTLIARRVNSVLKDRINDPHVRADVFQVTLTNVIQRKSFTQDVAESLLQKMINDAVATELECLKSPNRKMRQLCSSNLNQWESIDGDLRDCESNLKKRCEVESACATSHLATQLEAADALEAIEKYETNLTQKQRLVFHHMKEGLSASEIANILKYTPTYIRNIQRDIRVILRTHINS